MVMEPSQIFNQLSELKPAVPKDNIPEGLALAMFKVLAVDCDCEVCQLLRPAVRQMIQQIPAQPGPKLPSTRAIRRRAKTNG
jgi:hypothetical protein